MDGFEFLRYAFASMLACVLVPASALAQHADLGNWVDPADVPAQIMPLATHELLLGLVQSEDHYIAVGARGDVLLSKDGRDWRQVEVPTRTTFTAAAAVGNQVWAVGHGGVIMHSGDGGEHWQIQRKDLWHPAPNGGAAAKDPRQGAPLLDVLFTDAKHGYVVGAYSLGLRTDDGGATWTPMTVAVPAKPDSASPAVDSTAATSSNAVLDESDMAIGQEPNPYLNSIARTGSGALFIVGERGSAFRSRDQGTTWQRLKLPYDGSMFGVLGYAGDHVIAFGLRGHVYESSDLGDHWAQLQTGTELSLMGGAVLPGDGVVIVGANGAVLMRSKEGDPLKSLVDQTAGIIAAVLPLASGALLIAGENGIRTFQPN